VLDRRPAVLLAHRGAGVDHTTAAANIAALIETVAANPGRRILNSADPDAPDGLRIARVIATHLGHVWQEVLLDHDDDSLQYGDSQHLGRHPWDSAHPIVLDMTAARDLGYVPVGDYASTVAIEVDWLAAGARPGSGGFELPPGLDDPFFDSMFDYAAEDRYLEDVDRRAE